MLGIVPSSDVRPIDVGKPGRLAGQNELGAVGAEMDQGVRLERSWSQK